MAIFFPVAKILRRAQRINAYGKEYEAKQFLGLYFIEISIWYDALEFSFDMSVPTLRACRSSTRRVLYDAVFRRNMSEFPSRRLNTTPCFTCSMSIHWKAQTELIMEKTAW